MPFSPRPTDGSLALHFRRTLAALLLVVLTACRASQPPEAPGPEADGEATAGAQAELEGLWFQLRGGRFEQIPGPGQIRAVAMRPWTIQERVADVAELHGRLYLAVNGHGAAGLSLGPSDFPEFQPFYDPLLFRHRTFTRLLPRERSLWCHLYFNSLLNDSDADRLELKAVSLLELFPEEGIYRLRTPPLQRRDPAWECVGFVPAGDNEALLAWKRSDPGETRFAYTRLNLGERSERTASRDSFRRASAFKAFGARTDRGLVAAAQEAARLLRSPGIATGFQFLVRGRGGAEESRFQILPPDFEASRDIALVVVPVVHRDRTFTILSPDGRLLQSKEGESRVESRHLAGLPEGFLYTDLLLSGRLLVAAWEQRAFTSVGAAGLCVIRDPELSP